MKFCIDTQHEFFFVWKQLQIGDETSGLDVMQHRLGTKTDP